MSADAADPVRSASPSLRLGTTTPKSEPGRSGPVGAWLTGSLAMVLCLVIGFVSHGNEPPGGNSGKATSHALRRAVAPITEASFSEADELTPIWVLDVDWPETGSVGIGSPTLSVAQPFNRSISHPEVEFPIEGLVLHNFELIRSPADGEISGIRNIEWQVTFDVTGAPIGQVLASQDPDQFRQYAPKSGIRPREGYVAAKIAMSARQDELVGTLGREAELFNISLSSNGLLSLAQVDIGHSRRRQLFADRNGQIVLALPWSNEGPSYIEVTMSDDGSGAYMLKRTQTVTTLCYLNTLGLCITEIPNLPTGNKRSFSKDLTHIAVLDWPETPDGGDQHLRYYELSGRITATLLWEKTYPRATRIPSLAVSWGGSYLAVQTARIANDFRTILDTTVFDQHGRALGTAQHDQGPNMYGIEFISDELLVEGVHPTDKHTTTRRAQLYDFK